MLKLPRLTALFATLAAFLFTAATVAAQAPQDTTEEVLVGTGSNTMLYMLLIFALLVIVVIAFRRSTKKLKK